MAEPVAPVLNDLSRPFWDAAAEGRLVLPFCMATGRAFWPPSPSSPFALGGAVAWRDVAAEGVLLSRVTYRRAFQKAFGDRLPYAVALIEVTPGVRLQAHLADPDGPRAPLSGAHVRLGFAALAEGGPPIPIVETV
jgi:uncharacterized OB-fold protein